MDLRGAEAQVRLPPLSGPPRTLWHDLLDLGQAVDLPWCVVGGQMVWLHLVERGSAPVRVTQDGDLVADVRHNRDALRLFATHLESRGYAVDASADGLAHRFAAPRQSGGPVVIDLLAPDGLGERADLTTSPPGRTIQIPAGSLLLSEREPVHVVHEDRSGTIWRPSLYAAIVGKAAACELAKPDRHLADIAALMAEVDDPFALRARLTAKDRQRLRSAKILDDQGHSAWVALGGERRERGHAAWVLVRA